MVRVYIDTNVLLDYIQGRKDYKTAEKIFSAATTGALAAFISTQSIIDAAYISKKDGMSFEVFSQSIQALRVFVGVLSIDWLDIAWAVEHHSGDFEDDAQFSSAYSNVCDYFITRDGNLKKLNLPDYPMRIISPEDFVMAMES